MTEQIDASLDRAGLVRLPAAAESLPRPRNVEEILAIAYTMERESATRYGDLATCMNLLGRVDLATLFADLAREERHHVAEVKGLAQRILRRMPGLAIVFQWQLPQTLGAEKRAFITGSLTPYEALVTAVHNEERALAFWTAVAADADDAAVREQAETMARQELLHAGRLRVARRQAYHTGDRTGLEDRRGESDPEAMLSAIQKQKREVGQFLCCAAAQLSGQNEGMTAALLRFACEELAHRSSHLSDQDVDARQRDHVIVLFDAVGQLERLAEAAARYAEWYPDLARDHAVARLAKVASLQAAILARRLCELEPRLAAPWAGGAGGQAAL